MSHPHSSPRATAVCLGAITAITAVYAPPTQAQTTPSTFARQEDFVRSLFAAVSDRHEDEVEDLCRGFPLRGLHIVRDLLRRANVEADGAKRRDLARAIAKVIPGDVGDLARQVAKRDADLADGQRRDCQLFEAAIVRMGAAESERVLSEHGAAALRLAEGLGDQYLLARAHGLLGMRFYGLRRHDDARRHLRRAIAAIETQSAPMELAQDLHWLAEVELASRGFRSARDVLTRAIETAISVAERRFLTELLGRRAYAATRLGDAAAAEADLREAMRVATSLATDIGGREIEARTREAFASFYSETGRYSEALVELHRVERIWKRRQAPLDRARCLTSLAGISAELGRHADAGDYACRAEELYKNGEHEAARTRALLIRALALLDAGEITSALPIVAAAHDAALRTGHDAAVIQALLLRGRARLAAGDVATASSDFASARSRAEAASDATQLVLALLGQGEALLRGNRSDAARATFARALRYPADMAQAEVTWRVHFGLGRAAEQEANLPAARKHYENAIAAVESLRRGLLTAALRLRFLDQKLDLYWRAARLALRGGRLEDAFRYSEAAKARTLIEFDVHAPTPERGVLGELRRAEAELRFLERARIAAGTRRDDEQDEELNQRIAAARAAHRQARLELQLGTGRRAVLWGLSGLSGQVALSAIRDVLRPDVAVVEFHVGEAGTIAWVIRRQSAQAQMLAATSTSLESAVNTLLAPLERLARGQTDAANLRFDSRVAHALWAAVIEPLAPRLRGCEELWIIADGPLRRLPFPALVTRYRRLPVDPSRVYSQYHGCRFLIEDFAMLRVPTAALLLSPVRDRESTVAATEVLLVGDPEPMPAALPVLPNALREVRAVQDILPAGRALTGKRATEAAFRAAAVGARYLHLATHAELDPRRPAYSRLALAPDSTHDGWLYAYEIQDLQLTAEHAVLSACQSLGTPGGDGLLGMARAFLRAGVGRVLATAWPVDDGTSARVVGGYYRALADFLPPARALQRTQLTVLREGRSEASPTSHPFYWAGWVLLGQPRVR